MCAKKSSFDSGDSNKNNSGTEFTHRDIFNMTMAFAQLQQQQREMDLRIQAERNLERRRQKEQLRANYLQHHNAMQQNYQACNYIAARRDCEQAVRSYRESCDAVLTDDDKVVLVGLYFIAGRCCYLLRQYNESFQFCEDALVLYGGVERPYTHDILKLRVCIYLARGDIDRARESMGNILRGPGHHTYFQVALNYINNNNPQGIIADIQVWEDTNDQLIQNFLRCVNRNEPAIELQRRQVIITNLRQHLGDLENYYLMKAHALMSQKSFLKAAKYLNRIIQFIVLTTDNAWISRRYELLLLTNTTALCLSLEVCKDHHHPNLLRASLRNSIREIKDLLNEYHENTELVLYPDQCFIRSMTHYRLPLWLRAFADPINLDNMGGDRIYNQQDNDTLREIVVSQANINIADFNQAEPGVRIKILLRHFLTTAFITDHYDPFNLILYSHCTNLGLANLILHESYLAKAHLAFCFIHGQRIKRNLTKAWDLVVESGDANCARGLAEQGFMLYYGLGVNANRDIPAARQHLARAIAAVDIPEFEHLIELNGRERANIYLDIVNAEQIEGRPDGFNIDHVRIRQLDRGDQGSLLAKVQCAVVVANNNALLDQDRDLPVRLLEEVSETIHPSNVPDMSLGCVVFTRRLRNANESARARNILMRSMQLGSSEARLELSALLFSGFVHADGTPAGQNAHYLASEVDILHAVHYVKPVIRLNYFDRFIIDDQYKLLSLMYLAIYDLSTRASTIPDAIKVLRVCERNIARLHQTYASVIHYYLGYCLQFGQFANQPDHLNLAKLKYIDATQAANVDVNNHISRPMLHRSLARLSFLRQDQRLTEAQRQEIDAVLPQNQQINIETQVNNLNLHPRVSVRGTRIALIYKDQRDHAIYVHWGNLNRQTMDLTYDMQNNFYRVFDASYSDPNILILENNVALCTAGRNFNIYYQVLEFGANRTTTKLQTELVVEGQKSAMALTSDGATIVEAHLHESNNGQGKRPKVYYFTASVNARRVTWHRTNFFGDSGVGHCTRNPAIATLGNNRAVLLQECPNTVNVLIGSIQNNTIEWTVAGRQLSLNILHPQLFKMPALTCDADGNIFILGCSGAQNDDSLNCTVLRVGGTAQVPNLETRVQRVLYSVGYGPTVVCVDRNLLSFHLSAFVVNNTSRVMRRDIEINSIVPADNGQPNPTRYQLNP